MTGRALVVDDDQSMVRTLSDILQLKGWEVTTANNGPAAVELAATRPFDVVLMDVKMPGMDGVAALKAMKETHQDLRVVLMTAYAAKDRLAEAEACGVLRIMSKPVDIGALLVLLSSAVRTRCHILLIDHDAAFLRTMSEVLRLEGFDTVVADNIEHAKRLMMECSPAAVLLHLHLGATSARDAVSAIRAVSPAASLIVYSGRPSAEQEADEVIPRGAVYSYLQKPFAVEEVTGVLHAIRDRS